MGQCRREQRASDQLPQRQTRVARAQTRARVTHAHTPLTSPIVSARAVSLVCRLVQTSLTRRAAQQRPNAHRAVGRLPLNTSKNKSKTGLHMANGYMMIFNFLLSHFDMVILLPSKSRARDRGSRQTKQDRSSGSDDTTGKQLAHEPRRSAKRNRRLDWLFSSHPSLVAITVAGLRRPSGL